MRLLNTHMAALLIVACAPRPAPQPEAPDTTAAVALEQAPVRPVPDTVRPRKTGAKNAASVSFGRDILPLLAANCLACHRPGNMGGNYAVESRRSVVAAGTDSLPNVIAGRPDGSRLYKCMKEGHPPSAPPDSAALALVRAWIEQGARDN